MFKDCTRKENLPYMKGKTQFKVLYAVALKYLLYGSRE